jgi:hypothetical protein
MWRTGKVSYSEALSVVGELLDGSSLGGLRQGDENEEEGCCRVHGADASGKGLECADGDMGMLY